MRVFWKASAKIITALFADIKGSMEMMEESDPEEARRLVDPALELMIDAIHPRAGTSSNPPAMAFSRSLELRQLTRIIRSVHSILLFASRKI